MSGCSWSVPATDRLRIAQATEQDEPNPVVEWTVPMVLVVSLSAASWALIREVWRRLRRRR